MSSVSPLKGSKRAKFIDPVAQEEDAEQAVDDRRHTREQLDGHLHREPAARGRNSAVKIAAPMPSGAASTSAIDRDGQRP